jgi:hypothetical protein
MVSRPDDHAAKVTQEERVLKVTKQRKVAPVGTTSAKKLSLRPRIMGVEGTLNVSRHDAQVFE